MLKSKKENQLKVTVSSWLIGSGRPGEAAHFSWGRFSHTKEMNGTFNTSVISGSRETGWSPGGTSVPTQRTARNCLWEHFHFRGVRGTHIPGNLDLSSDFPLLSCCCLKQQQQLQNLGHIMHPAIVEVWCFNYNCLELLEAAKRLGGVLLPTESPCLQ